MLSLKEHEYSKLLELSSPVAVHLPPYPPQKTMTIRPVHKAGNN
jgi:hypothetical protein